MVISIALDSADDFICYYSIISDDLSVSFPFSLFLMYKLITFNIFWFLSTTTISSTISYVSVDCKFNPNFWTNWSA